ncbi:MAG: toll/interleukin-1 receptor domain-containing protein [Planctomycetota bacterium]|nr:toll/interleukin-1 receptor domain-containing protein [Planctomycetota bacterium]
MENALNEVRFGGAHRCESCHFSIKGCVDLPDWKEHLGTCVFYLLGKADLAPRSFVIWDADAIDSILHFHDLVNDGKSIPHLQSALKEFDLLFLGVSFADWLTRFLLRVARQNRHSSDTDYSEYLAERGCDVAESFVGFCRGARRGTKILRCEPIAFVDSLFERWTARQIAIAHTTISPRRDFVWPERWMPKGAVFISYAHEDVLAAQRMADGLRQAGCNVWLDRERLSAGENWENSLEIQVKRQCSVFISLISRSTEMSAGYCHRERKWAADRDPDFGRDGSFYVPVTIDATQVGELAKENLPARSINVWQMPQGETTREFVSRIIQLHKANQTGEFL